MTSDGYEKRPSVRSLTEASSEGVFHAILDGNHPSFIIPDSRHLLSLELVVTDGIFDASHHLSDYDYKGTTFF